MHRERVSIKTSVDVKNDSKMRMIWRVLKIIVDKIDKLGGRFSSNILRGILKTMIKLHRIIYMFNREPDRSLFPLNNAGNAD